MTIHVEWTIVVEDNDVGCLMIVASSVNLPWNDTTYNHRPRHSRAGGNPNAVQNQDIPVWRFTIADQAGNDDTLGGTMVVEDNDIGNLMIVRSLTIFRSLMIPGTLTISLETTPHTTTSPVIPAQAGILMRCKIKRYRYGALRLPIRPAMTIQNE